MKRVSLLLLFALAFAGISFGQLGTSSVTYTDGDIETDKYFYSYYGTQFSTCPGSMTVTIPVGAIILHTDVSYDMTSDENSNLSKQRSHFRCVSPGGINEAEMTKGPYIYEPGTLSYSRTVDIANGVVGGGDIMFELHAGAQYYKHWCTTDSVKVDNNTWTVSVTYIPAGFPAQAINPDPVDVGFYVGLDDDLSWDFGADTESYDVYFGTDNPPTTKLVDNEVAGASGTFDPGTMDETQTYYWQVVSRNANGYTYGPVWSFTTVCGAFATPFSEDFEEVITPELPYCWQNIFNSTAAYAKLGTTSYGGNNGPACLEMSNGDDMNATLILVAPKVDVEGGTLADKMVNLFVKGSSFPGFSVGTMSDPSDESTFTAYETFYAYNDYQEYDIYLNNYVGTDEYIAFKMVPNTTYQAAYIDDITIKDMPTCLRPTDLAADDLSINSAMLSWVDPNGAAAWNIEYGEAGFTPTGVPTVSGVSNPYELTGLTSATEYDYYVQTDCGGGDLSQWSSVYTFLTPCDFYEVPFSENFDDWGWGEMPPCWSTILLCNDFSAMNGNLGYGYIQLENANDLNSTLMLISPPIQDLAVNKIKFNALCWDDGYDLIIGTMSNPTDQSTFEALTSVTIGTAYEEYEVWLNGYMGTNNYFAIKHSNGSQWLHFQIDDVSVEALPSCLPPVDLFISDKTTTTAQFNWTESGTATDWVIELGAAGFEPGTGSEINSYNQSDAGQDQSIELSGLAAGTSYAVYVKSDCGDGDESNWSGPVNFLSAFPNLTIPVMEDFESGLGITGNSPENDQDWEINTDLFVSGAQSVYNPYGSNNDNVLYILGNFDFTAKTDLMLSFQHMAFTDDNNDHCYIEISTDGGQIFDQLPEPSYFGAGYYREEGLYNNPEGPCFDMLSYDEWVNTGGVPSNDLWKKEYFDLSDYSAYENVQIRFRLVSNDWNEGAGWFIDDIAIETLGAAAFSVDPLLIDEVVVISEPVVNVDLMMGNTGDFPASFMATVVYDETELINENFNSGIPAEWTVVSRGTMSDISWEDTASIFGRNIDGTPFAWCDGLQAYAVPLDNTMDDDLISPAVDVSTYAGATLQLEWDQVFDADYNPGDTAKVFVYDGQEWMLIYESWTDDGSIYSGGDHKVYDVSAYANANFQVKFKYIEGSLTKRGRYYAIDNVRLRASMSALDWLSVDGAPATSGVAMPSDGAMVDVGLDATGLDYGVYTASIEVVTDEPGKIGNNVLVTMTVTPPAPPTALTAVTDLANIDLAYMLNEAGNDVIIATNSSDTFDQPENGMDYPVGEMIGANGTVIYQGSMTEFTHADLAPNITFYYKAWSVDGMTNYSIEGPTANASTGDYQLICLDAGWSGVSAYKIPENLAMENVLSGIANEMEILLSNTGFYWPSSNVNTIGNWNPQMGYKVKMNEAACFTMVGDMSEDNSFMVNTGSNYIPVLCDQSVLATEIFAQLGNDLVFAFDIQTQAIYWPEGGIFTLEMLEPGVGYLVSMAAPGEASYSCEIPTKAGYAKAQKQVFENAPWEYTETGNQHLISINKDAFADLERGTFIGVFNSHGVCVGYTQYNGETGNLLLVAYSDDMTTDAIDGLQDGEEMTFRTFNPSLELETEVAVQFDASLPNNASFAEMGRSMILKFGEGATSISENVGTEISMYPNPATDMVHINLNSVDNAVASVVIYDMEGRTVISQVFNGQAELNVSSLEAGVYFVRINTNTISEIRKLVIK